MTNELQVEICVHCDQRKTYWVTVSPGVCETLGAIAKHIKQKGINIVHPRKEIEGKSVTSNQVGNLSTARFHGLIAKVEGESGNYALTRKGLDFLNGQPIPLHANVMKQTVTRGARTIGHGEEMCVIDQFSRNWMDYWRIEGFYIQEGRIITTLPSRENQVTSGPKVIDL